MNTNELPTTATRTLVDICLGSCQKMLLQIQKAKNAILANYRESSKATSRSCAWR